MSALRIADGFRSVGKVWRRAFLDAFLAPRRFRKTIGEYRRLDDMLYHPGIEDLEPAQIPGEAGPIQLLSIPSHYGGQSPQDLYALLRVVRWIQPKRIFEIGTYQGVTTAHLALNTDATIFTLDLPRDLARDLQSYSQQDSSLLQERDQIGSAYRPYAINGRIQQLFGDSRTFDYRPFAGSMDLALIDGCHLFDYVMSDSRSCFPLLSPKGVILWHDFGYSMDVSRALHILAKDRTIFHLQGTAFALYVANLPSRAELHPLLPQRLLRESDQNPGEVHYR